MPRHLRDLPSLDPLPQDEQPAPQGQSAPDRRKDLPSVEDGGLSDNTVASPVLGFGMDRMDLVEEPPQTPQEQPLSSREQPISTGESYPHSPSYQPDPNASYEPDADYEYGVLGRNEVAAVSGDREFYVSDIPSPYLSSRQAQEDVNVTRRRHSRKTAILVTLFILVLLGAGVWFIWTNTHSQTREAVKQYETRTIESGEYLETIDATSLVRPINEVTVTPNVSGTVAEVFVENDKDVQEGEALFRLDNPTITDALSRAESTLTSYQEEVNRKQDALNKANETLEKLQPSSEQTEKKEGEESSSTSSTNSTTSSSTTASASVIEAAKKEVEKAQTELDAANINLQNMQDTYNRALEQVEALTVTAPISGKVSELNEQAVAPNSVSGSTRLCTISDTSQYSLEMEIPKDQESRVHVDQEVRLTFPSIKDLAVTSKVASLDQNEEGGTLLATVNIENPDEHIKTGIAAEASLILKSIPDTLIVPTNALRTAENGSTHLDVLLDSTRGIVTDVEVKVLATDGTKAAVQASNIQADTAVVLPSGDSSSDSSSEKK